MSHQHFFLRPSFRLFAFFITSFYLSTGFGATAQSSATVSWAAAFDGWTPVFTSYSAGSSQDNLTETVSFSGVAPSNAAPQGVNYGSVDTGSSAFADSTSLLVESHATDGGGASEALMAAFFLFDGMGSGTLNISIPYTLSTLVQPGVGSSSLTIIASLEVTDFNSITTNPITPDPKVELSDFGLGAPNDLTGMLSLTYDFDESTDLAAVLNINVISDSSAAPIMSVPLKTVPIPGGIALAIPALLPLFASRKENLSRQQS